MKTIFILLLSAISAISAIAVPMGFRQTDTLRFGLIGWWTFNNASGTNFVDSSGSGNNAFATNAVLFGPGIIGAAMLATNGVFCGSNNASLHPAAITVSAWIKSAGSQVGNACIVVDPIANDTAPAYVSYALQVSTQPNWTVGTAVYNTLTATAAPPTGQWMLLTGTYDGSSLSCLYTNGVLCISGSVNGSLTYAPDQICIGWESPYGFTRTFNGSIDDVRIYNRSLTAAEILLLYGGGYGYSQ